MKNKIKILLDLYGTYYSALIDSQALIKALESLPPDMQLPPKFTKTALGFAQVEKMAKDRVKELKRDEQILTARVVAIKEGLAAIRGGAKALETWEWEPLKI